MASLPVLPRPPLITLTTDFGLADHFVGVMKGVILSVNDAWLRFGEENGLDRSYHFLERDYLDVCHRASILKSRS